MEIIKRRPNRLNGYDYSQNGAYFVTVCKKNKEKILCRIVVGEGLCALPKILLTDIGVEVENSIKHINNMYNNVIIDKYVIMPNHIHLIIRLNSKNETGGRGNPPLQNIIYQLKSYTTHKYGAVLWQRSFHDHIIRGESDYVKIWQYIDTNPLKWEDDCFYNK